MKKYYTCFNCPKENKSEERELEDYCPFCNKKYGFPLIDYPKTIGEYKIIEPLGRGFYSATYKVESIKFKNKFSVLKVIPEKVYKYFGKNFNEECQEHSDVAEESEHIVKIENYFNENVKFGGETLDCHIAVIEFVDGFSIEEIIEKSLPLKAEAFTQIAIDLFRILSELKQKHKRHNDLHEGNIIIQKLKKENYRFDAIDPTIRAKAIDINSTQDGCEEYPPEKLRDLQRVSRIIRKICQLVLDNPDKLNDLSYRAATKLLEISFELDTIDPDYRFRDPREIINTIKAEFEESQLGNPPWRKEFKIKRVNDYYNAQALEPWHVNYLFVDPEDKWMSSISSPGPQLITGMRGCGKTILLKSLQFHARAVPHKENEPQNIILNRLKNDGFVGLYLSSSRLIDITGKDDKNRLDPFSILFIGYLKSLIQTIKHLQDIKKDLVISNYYKNILELISDVIPNAESLRYSIINDTRLNMELEKIQNSLLRGESKFKLKIKPVFAFESLARVVRKSSPLWENHHIYFLLDDVSTRYINKELIKKLVSQLMIQNEMFSFKITSEEHIIAYILHSPGNIEKARPGRDYSLFNFGYEVKETIHGKFSKHRKDFVEDILKKRLNSNKLFAHSLNLFPKTLLGNTSLKNIAENIANSSKTSTERKRVYFGFSALTAMCVGDIGDIIILYDRFVNLSYSKNQKALSAAEQTKIYLDFCSHRLYDLNRLKTEMRHYALGFAEASHDLLLESAKKNQGINRLRQYNSIYINITSNLKKEQEKLLEEIGKMIDAGIFVPAGLAFRSKPGGTNPLLQFSITFRKIFGLSNFIGLSESDRFELSGKELVDWLHNPDKDKCKRILMANLSNVEIEDNSVDNDDEEIEAPSFKIVDTTPKTESIQSNIFDEEKSDIKRNLDLFKYSMPEIRNFKINENTNLLQVNELILGLGFEERAVESIKRYSNSIMPNIITLVQYKNKGHSTAIRKLLKSYFPKSTIEERIYEELRNNFVASPGKIFIDVSGLSKAIIFNALRYSVINNRHIYICHTEAKSYYPTDSETERVYKAYEREDHYKFIDAFEKILGGEKPPFAEINLMKTEADESRNRILIAFVRPKNERLYHMLDKREFDKIELITPKEHSSKRSKVAKMAAELVAKKFNNTTLSEYDSNDISGALNFLTQKYQEYYVNLNYNMEIALTGSKRQTIAVAMLSSVCKLSKVWYIRPDDVDPKRFSKGVGNTTYFEIKPKYI